LRCRSRYCGSLREEAAPSPKLAHLILNTSNCRYTEQQIAEFYAGGDRYVLGAIPFDPAQLLKELRGGKTVAELTAWAPRA
jgi:hypothetical protein